MEVLRKAFTQQLSKAVTEFVASVDADEVLIGADLQGSLAHVSMLGKTGLLTEAQAANIKCGLQELQQQLAAGKLSLKVEFEDVHMNVEKQLEQCIGTDALRLHSARSRNDQVAVDLRIYSLDQIALVRGGIKVLQQALVAAAETNNSVIMPGYTHLQRAQPVLFAHAMLAFYEMLSRDESRFKDAAKRTAVSPLGAGAQAGTSLPIDPQFSAKQLGMGVFSNSMDAVSDRDFVAEFLFCASMTATHLSQLAETLILWATREFGFVRFGDNVTTSSSLMPQKKNPDPVELVRGKTGSVFGELINVLTTLKGLPLGYNRDLQETKPPIARVAENLLDSLNILAIAISSMEVNSIATSAAACDPEIMSTDLVEYLVRAGVPFREAHDSVSAAIAFARENRLGLNEMSLQQFRSFASQFDADLYDVFDPTQSIKSKRSHGSTGEAAVAAALIHARQQLNGLPAGNRECF